MCSNYFVVCIRSFSSKIVDKNETGSKFDYYIGKKILIFYSNNFKVNILALLELSSF